jgi:hypothetical protein
VVWEGGERKLAPYPIRRGEAEGRIISPGAPFPSMCQVLHYIRELASTSVPMALVSQELTGVLRDWPRCKPERSILGFVDRSGDR